ncbi:MAG: hypothetical protein OJK14_12240, partial [Achromobacter sp.]|nr:hypothetical protein [Achromobacter sp.]
MSTTPSTEQIVAGIQSWLQCESPSNFPEGIAPFQQLPVVYSCKLFARIFSQNPERYILIARFIITERQICMTQIEMRSQQVFRQDHCFGYTRIWVERTYFYIFDPWANAK